MAAAAELLASPHAHRDEIERALEALVNDSDSVDEFRKAFGPRRLMKALGCGALTERAQELADTLLNEAVDKESGVGLVAEVDFSSVHADQLFPDELVPLATRSPPQQTCTGGALLQVRLLWLHLPITILKGPVR